MNKKLTSFAKVLRKNSTDAERLLWKYLRHKQLGCIKFRRQQFIGNYIVDFVCLDQHLIVELDGGQHAEENKDIERDKWLKQQGFKVLRFWNNEVLQNINGVLEVIIQNTVAHPPLTPPLKGGEKHNVRYI